MDIILFLIVVSFIVLIFYTYGQVAWWIIGYVTREYKKFNEDDKNVDN
jgi:hypothetical protein